ADPQTAPSYLSAPNCVPTPTDLATLGFPDMHIAMTVHGTEGGELPAIPAGLLVDPVAGAGVLHNRVLEMGETPVAIVPTWMNAGLSDFTMTGSASNFTGPGAGAGITYSIPDNTANYGTITAGGSAACLDCYGVAIDGTRDTQPVHMDASM